MSTRSPCIMHRFYFCSFVSSLMSTEQSHDARIIRPILCVTALSAVINAMQISQKFERQEDYFAAFSGTGLCQAPSAAISASACFGPQLPGW